MSSGKTTLGQHVAAQFNVDFIDLDQQIEIKSGKSIFWIFNEDGEDHFRKLEASLLRETASIPKAIIATGGGTPVYHHNMDWMLENGITMYLEWNDDVLLDLLMTQRNGRPLISDKPEDEARQYALEILEERKPFYQQSSMTLSMTGEFEKDAGLLAQACKYIW